MLYQIHLEEEIDALTANLKHVQQQIDKENEDSDNEDPYLDRPTIQSIAEWESDLKEKKDKKLEVKKKLKVLEAWPVALYDLGMRPCLFDSMVQAVVLIILLLCLDYILALGRERSDRVKDYLSQNPVNKSVFGAEEELQSRLFRPIYYAIEDECNASVQLHAEEDAIGLWDGRKALDLTRILQVAKSIDVHPFQAVWLGNEESTIQHPVIRVAIAMILSIGWRYTDHRMTTEWMRSTMMPMNFGVRSIFIPD